MAQVEERLFSKSESEDLSSNSSAARKRGGEGDRERERERSKCAPCPYFPQMGVNLFPVSFSNDKPHINTHVHLPAPC
jgi:hypothetical protein